MAIDIPIGTTGTKSWEVTEARTVAGADARMPPVFSTPKMVELIETAAAEVMASRLPAGWVSVGVVVNVKHLAATGVGDTVTAEAKVVAADDRTVTFAVEVHDRTEKIGEATHVRAPIEVERLLKRVRAKTGG